jgi:uncharacterized surface protein with fasciclin (FAS1) repeats
MLPIRRSTRLRRALLPAASLLCLSVSPVAAQRGDIPTVARSAGQFATLVTALEAAGLTSTLRGNGPFTVFAPTDEAFRKLPAGTVENLLKPENVEQLRSILLYHVVPGRVTASQARRLNSASTVEGRSVRIRNEGSTLRINSATVLRADVPATNGVIHVIDEVLLPPDRVSADEPDRASDARAARELLSLAVRRGAPLFNDGNVEATAAIYEVAARSVLALGNRVDGTARRALERGLRDADRERDQEEKAWVLRRAIDDADRSLESGRRRMPATRAH